MCTVYIGGILILIYDHITRDTHTVAEAKEREKGKERERRERGRGKKIADGRLPSMSVWPGGVCRSCRVLSHTGRHQRHEQQ